MLLIFLIILISAERRVNSDYAIELRDEV